VCVCVCVCDRVYDRVRMYARVCDRVWPCVCPDEDGSVPITTSGAGETAFTSAAKPKSKATAHTSVMRLGSSIVERARVQVGVGERVCAGAMTAQKCP
jgi:hypothetical protein